VQWVWELMILRAGWALPDVYAAAPHNSALQYQARTADALEVLLRN
jgi:hypothetical protein